SGYRVLSRRLVKTFPILTRGFELETEITLHALDKRLRILEVPIAYQDRPLNSHSKLRTVRDGIRVLSTIVQVLRFYRPFLFFGVLSAIFFALGVIVGIPVIVEYIYYRYIYAIPKAILATGLMVFSVVLMSIAVLLDTVARLHK